MGLLHVSLTLYNLAVKLSFTNVDLNLSCPTRGHSVWTNLRGYTSCREAVAETAKTG